jgi:non-specific serine/threonine protein kinase
VVFEKQVKERPPAIPGLPAGMDALLRQLLEKNPADRPADADELYRRLEPFAVSLPMLPGFLTQAPSPGRMYARMVGRVLS